LSPALNVIQKLTPSLQAPRGLVDAPVRTGPRGVRSAIWLVAAYLAVRVLLLLFFQP